LLHRALFAAILALFLLLGAGNALTRRPWGDEVFISNSAYDLITRGKSGMTVLEPTGLGSLPGTVMLGIHERNYHVMPLSWVAQAGWYKIFGFSLPAMRFFALAWGLLALVCWKYIVETLTGSQALALLTASLLAIDYAFLQGATDGRPDMMSMSLGACAFAAYLKLRETSLPRAILACTTLLTLSIFTHPNGILAGIPILLTYLMLDRRRSEWKQIPIAAAPFLVGIAAYGAFIIQDPAAYKAQFGLNAGAGGRLNGITRPVQALIDEVRIRYFERFYLPVYATGIARLRVLIILLYWGGLLWAIAVPGLRRKPRYRLLFAAAVLDFLALALFDGTRSYFYMVHILPLYAAALAVCLKAAWELGRAAKLAALGVFGLLAFLQLGWSVYAIAKNPYRNTYLPAIKYLREHAGSNATIIGTGELGFALGFDANLRDDSALGFYSGRKADFIVLDERAYKQSLLSYAAKVPELDRYVRRILADEYHPVYDGPFYEIYQRK
jgi:hypothetical protein